MSQGELIHMLATKWHLSVSERNLLLDRRAKAILICSAIENILRENGWYPQDWRPEMDFDGGVIEFRSDGRCRIYWKTEVGVMRFASVEVQECDSPSVAANAWLRRMFPVDIDGILVDWTDIQPRVGEQNGA